MLLTQAQVRELVDISEETFRTWRGVLPMLRRPKGGPSFTLGDVLALRILRDMVNDLGMRISTVAPFGSELFDICEEAIESHQAAEHLTFGSGGFDAISGILSLEQVDKPSMLLPLRATVVALREQLISRGHVQALLPFPTNG